MTTKSTRSRVFHKSHESRGSSFSMCDDTHLHTRVAYTHQRLYRPTTFKADTYPGLMMLLETLMQERCMMCDAAKSLSDRTSRTRIVDMSSVINPCNDVTLIKPPSTSDKTWPNLICELNVITINIFSRITFKDRIWSFITFFGCSRTGTSIS